MTERSFALPAVLREAEKKGSGGACRPRIRSFLRRFLHQDSLALRWTWSSASFFHLTAAEAHESTAFAPLLEGADAAIVVEGQPRSGGPFVRLGVARTDGQGRFSFAIPAGPSRTVRYRFTATTGLRRYTFRAVVAREAAYPYEKGVSRTVKVIVRGR